MKINIPIPDAKEPPARFNVGDTVWIVRRRDLLVPSMLPQYKCKKPYSAKIVEPQLYESKNLAGFRCDTGKTVDFFYLEDLFETKAEAQKYVDEHYENILKKRIEQVRKKVRRLHEETQTTDAVLKVLLTDFENLFIKGTQNV